MVGCVRPTSYFRAAAATDVAVLLLLAAAAAVSDVGHMNLISSSDEFMPPSMQVLPGVRWYYTVPWYGTGGIMLVGQT